MKLDMKTKYPNLQSLKVFYGEHRMKMFLFVLFTAISGILTLAIPIYVSEMTLDLTDGKYDPMVTTAIVIFLLVIGVAGTGMIAGYYYTVVTNDIFLNIRRKIAYCMMSMRLSTIYDKGSGFFLERLNEDGRDASVVSLNIWQAVINIVVNIGFIGLLTAINIYLGLLFASGLAVLMFLEYLRVSHLLENMKKGKRAIEKVKSKESELLKGIKEIKGLNAKEATIYKHTAVSSQYVDIKYNREMYQKKMQSVIDAFKGVIDISMMLLAGIYLLPHGMVETLTVLIIYMYKGNIYSLISGLAKIKDTYVNGELSAKRINDIIAPPKNEVDGFGDKSLSEEINTIEFRDVVFEYSKDKKVLNGINFKIDGAGIIGFVGASGSGKSTIFSILARFYDPTEGIILINGTDIMELSEGDIRRSITPVLQDPYIFNDTVMNNLLLARPDASSEDVIEACRAARIHDEIMEMPDGYDTVVGENGATISGGQKQRLEIARVLLKNSRVMLFDEATSALDKNNLEKINNLMIELSKTKIVLVVAHRLSIMKRCDRVVVLEGGKIVATGPHDELMKTCDYYRELFKRNAGTETKNG
jgi:ABC-type multidrug transport system fused ATPase/permease subunit